MGTRAAGECFHSFRVLPNFHECFYNSIEISLVSLDLSAFEHFTHVVVCCLRDIFAISTTSVVNEFATEANWKQIQFCAADDSFCLF